MPTTICKCLDSDWSITWLQLVFWLSSVRVQPVLWYWKCINTQYLQLSSLVCWWSIQIICSIAGCVMGGMTVVTTRMKTLQSAWTIHVNTLTYSRTTQMNTRWVSEENKLIVILVLHLLSNCWSITVYIIIFYILLEVFV